MSTQHARFLARLAASADGVFKIARWYHSKGIRVEIPGMQLAPSADQHEAYSDNGDLIVIDGHRKVLNVKRLTTLFTGTDDWPHKNDNGVKHAFVSSKADVERGVSELYVFLSHDMKTAGFIKASTAGAWYVAKALNKNTGNLEYYYACPLNCVEWRQL
jgi:hypothetical protein